VAAVDAAVLWLIGLGIGGRALANPQPYRSALPAAVYACHNQPSCEIS